MALQSEFTFFFYDLRTNVKLAELPLTSVQFSQVLNGAGTFSAVLDMSDSRVTAALGNAGGASQALQTSRTAIYVDLNGDLVWGGILWTAQYDGTKQEVRLNGQEFWSYFASRRISWGDNIGPTTFANIDQFTVFQSLINSAQSVYGGDIGVTVPNTISGYLINAIGWDQSQLTPITQAISTLTQQNGALGFDFAIDVAYDVNGVPQKYLNLSYPRRGRVAGVSRLVFDVNNRWSMGYKWPVDGVQLANIVYGVGAGSGPPTTSQAGTPVSGGGLRSTATYQAAIDAGYPVLEGNLQRSDVIDQNILNNLTLTYLAAVAYPVVLPQVTFDIAMPDPQFGSYIVGDDIELRIGEDEWFPSASKQYWRLIGQKVNVPNEGVVTVELTLMAPPLVM